MNIKFNFPLKSYFFILLNMKNGFLLIHQTAHLHLSTIIYHYDITK